MRITTVIILMVSMLAICCSDASSDPPAGRQPETLVAESKPVEPAASSVKSSRSELRIGDSPVAIESTSSLQGRPIYFRPHEDETTSGEATRAVISKLGGKLVELRSQGDRMIGITIGGTAHTFDPNRIFTRTGIKKTLGDKGSSEAVVAIEGFVETLFREHLSDRKFLIAVHNNTDGASLTINSYKGNREALDVFINPDRDEDDFFYLTSREHFEALKAKGFNVALQDPATVDDDGSLSVYCSKNGIVYVNVEAERGHLNEQIEMLHALHEAISNSAG